LGLVGLSAGEVSLGNDKLIEKRRNIEKFETTMFFMTIGVVCLSLVLGGVAIFMPSKSSQSRKVIE